VVAEELLLKTPGLQGRISTFSGQEIGESPGNETGDAFEISAPANGTDTRSIDRDDGSNPGLVLTDANIQATYLATDQNTLPELQVSVEVDSDGDGEIDAQPGGSDGFQPE
jgi:hypothetical protein